MSSDNGYIVRVHPKGGFALVGYCASIAWEEGYDTSDKYPLATGNMEQFPSIQAALNACEGSTNWMEDRYYSEYGAHCDDEVKKIQQSLLSELHEEVRDKYENGAIWCSCGYHTVEAAMLYKHQANALREQLRQLGG